MYPEAFIKPFNWLKCRERGFGDITISGAPEWEIHVENPHGRTHSPRLTEESTTTSSTGTCFICEVQLPAGVPKHYSTRSEVFISGKLLQCQECVWVPGEKSEKLTGDDMLLHLATVHNRLAITRCGICNHFFTQRHTRGQFKTKSSLATCPCPSGEEGLLLPTLSSWHLHATTITALQTLPFPRRLVLNARGDLSTGTPPSPVLSPGDIAEWQGKGHSPGAKSDVATAIRSPPVSDIDEADASSKRAKVILFHLGLGVDGNFL